MHAVSAQQLFPDKKFCRNCKHFEFHNSACHHTNNIIDIDLVHGELITKQSPAQLREQNDCCGQAANWFESNAKIVIPAQETSGPKAARKIGVDDL